MSRSILEMEGEGTFSFKKSNALSPPTTPLHLLLKVAYDYKIFSAKRCLKIAQTQKKLEIFDW